MATVSAALKKDKKGEYKAELDVTNTGSEILTDWYVTCNLTPPSTITSIKNYTLSQAGNVVTLVPDSKRADIKPGKTMSEKFDGVSPMPGDFSITISGGPTGPSGASGSTGTSPTGTSGSTGTTGPTGPVNYLINMPMTEYKTMDEVSAAGGGNKWQYSFNAHSGFSETSPNPAYFSLDGANGLKACIYQGDKPFQSGNSTSPRTEMRNLSSIKDNVAYTLSFDRFLANEPKFDFCWFQIFGSSGPNLIFRWRSGTYQVLSDAGDHFTTNFPGTPADEVGVWVNWTCKFYLDKKAGWLQLYRNGVMVAEYSGANNAGGGNSYLKSSGIYAQQMNPANDVVTYTRNLVLYY